MSATRTALAKETVSPAMLIDSKFNGLPDKPEAPLENYVESTINDGQLSVMDNCRTDFCLELPNNCLSTERSTQLVECRVSS